MDTNREMEEILGQATSRRTDLQKKLDEAREKNLVREFEAFKARGGVLPKWKPRTEPGKRYSTTTSSSYQDRFSEMPPRSELMKTARDRKMANWTPQIKFGDEKIDYQTDARKEVNSNAFAESVAATLDCRSRAKQMKANLTKTQWQLGVSDTTMADFGPTSRLPDPTGPDFASYRGVLDPQIGQKIKKSTAFAGILDPSIKINYESVAQAGMKSGSQKGPDQNDFKSVKAHAKKLKQELSGSTFVFGDAERNLTTDYRDGFQYSPVEAKTAKEKLDPEMLKDLRSAHFTFAPDNGSWEMADPKNRYVSDSEMNNRKFVADLKGEKRDVKAEKERNARMKLRLQRNTFQLGTEEEYMY
ncbi:hypothetical protein TrVE_jg4447 [Triparma verrucosa]|uniref:Uncharacterized protein n=1 Tax=Triparma verrucosa TaxID=1606542 RepID=A0A9W7EQN3_9STRA|nr:hypothetical protein TrVE_jg4447 [Triparma verrucosa]|mmetsp:Transcript_1239/g.2098  ORF Transcript_1239/g.2098 Transcript_1239/m.2098 type:complete len:358 (-) Transcript_1239:26-1099(-)